MAKLADIQITVKEEHLAELKKFNSNWERFLEEKTCDGCKHLKGRYCLLVHSHCIRRAEDYYAPGVKGKE